MKFSIKSVYKLTVISGLIMIALFIFTSQVFAQKPDYKYTDVFGYAFGGTGDAINYGTTIDPSGNVYVTGTFDGIIDFDPSAGFNNKTAVGNYDVFLTKINADESYAYTYTFGGSAADAGRSVTTDSSGNVYITGSFQGTVNFDPTGGTDNHTSAGSEDGFLTKINANGTYGYTRTFGGVLAESGNGVTTDSSGNVYVTGQFQVATDFDPTPGAHDVKSPVGTSGAFLMKINANGTYGYTDTFSGAGNSPGYGVTTDSSGNIYLTGYFEGTVDFDPSGGTDNHTSAGGHDIFLTKINANGTYGYTDTFGGGAEDQGNAVKTDSSGNVYLTGYFSGTADFPVGGTDPKISAGGFDIFLTKINANGTYGYTDTFGGTGYDFGNAVTTDSDGNIYLAGNFVGTVDFDPTAGTDNQTAGGADDGFLTKINADGTYDYTYIFGGSDPINDDTFSEGGVAVDSNGIYIAGRFINSADFDPTAGVDIRTTSSSDYVYAWLTKLVFPSTPPPTPPVHHSGGFVTPLIKVLKVPTPLDLPTGPGPVAYNYAVSNIGIIAMINITVTDNKCSPVVFISGDINNDSKLDTNEIWNYRCSMTLSQTTTNIVTATGQAFSFTATDSANATVVVSLPPPPTITPPVVPPIITPVVPPKLPKTGFPPRGTGESIPWSIVIFSTFVAVSIALEVILRKRTISPLNKD